MRRGNDELEQAQLVRLHIDGAVSADVGFDPLEHPEAAPIFRVQFVDRRVLIDNLRHRHPARNRQSVGVIGHAGALISAGQARLHNRVERLRSVAPDRVHLEVAAVLRPRRRTTPRQHLLHRRSTHEVLAEPPQGGDRFFLAGRPYRLLH
jgi:hypothetical protein